MHAGNGLSQTAVFAPSIATLPTCKRTLCDQAASCCAKLQIGLLGVTQSLQASLRGKNGWLSQLGSHERDSQAAHKIHQCWVQAGQAGAWTEGWSLDWVEKLAQGWGEDLRWARGWAACHHNSPADTCKGVHTRNISAGRMQLPVVCSDRECCQGCTQPVQGAKDNRHYSINDGSCCPG